MRTLERVVEIVARIADAPVVRAHPDERIFEKGLVDSLGAVDLILELSREFHIPISPADVDRDEWATPERIASDIERRIAL